MNDSMTPGEMSRARAMANQQFRVWKAAADELRTERVARAEEQLSRRFAEDDERWAAWSKKAQQLAGEANEAIRVALEEEGIPKTFMPHFRTYFYDRGENAEPVRRAELRRMAAARATADMKAAITTIEREKGDIEMRILGGELSFAEARELVEELASRPVEIDPVDVDALMLEQKPRRRR